MDNSLVSKLKLKPLYLSLLSIALVSVQGVYGQAAKPAATHAAAPKAASPVDSVIQLVKSGMSENLIIKTLQRQNKPIDLSPADLVKLKNAGVSENVIGVMMDPSSAPAAATPAAAPIPAAPPQSAAPASSPGPAAYPAQPAVPSVPMTAAVANAMKKRVIVDEFDYSAVMTNVAAVFGTNQNIGKGIRAMLTDRLGQQQKVVIVERAKINSLMAEQDRNASNRVKQGSGAKIGRISGADALLTGDITIFGRDDKKKHASGGGGLFGAGVGAIAASRSSDKAVVAIAYRVVDAETSEVVATGEARGESIRKGSALGALGGAFGKGFAGAEFDMTSSNFAQTIIGEATQDCVNKLADILDTQVAGMKKEVRAVEATVADVSGSSIVITAGSNDGVNAGDVFEVLRSVREVKDPTTHEVLDRITEKTGELTVVSVRDKIATGAYTGSAAQVGFIVRRKN
jgi:curli biogenesis system outer membrane secretion channel CsgG